MTEQCIFCSGRPPSTSAMSWLVTFSASSRVMPITISVNAELEAMALAQPNV